MRHWSRSWTMMDSELILKCFLSDFFSFSFANWGVNLGIIYFYLDRNWGHAIFCHLGISWHSSAEQSSKPHLHLVPTFLQWPWSHNWEWVLTWYSTILPYRAHRCSSPAWKPAPGKISPWVSRAPRKRNSQEGQEPVSFGLWGTSSRVTPQAVEPPLRKRRDRSYWGRLKPLHSSSGAYCLSVPLQRSLSPIPSKEIN